MWKLLVAVAVDNTFRLNFMFRNWFSSKLKTKWKEEKNISYQRKVLTSIAHGAHVITQTFVGETSMSQQYVSYKLYIQWWDNAIQPATEFHWLNSIELSRSLWYVLATWLVHSNEIENEKYNKQTSTHLFEKI